MQKLFWDIQSRKKKKLVHKQIAYIKTISSLVWKVTLLASKTHRRVIVVALYVRGKSFDRAKEHNVFWTKYEN